MPVGAARADSTRSKPVCTLKESEAVMLPVHERAGIEILGPYRSKGKSRKLADALHALSRVVEVPAIDVHLFQAIRDRFGIRLNVDEENRSVTSDQWVERALLAYGCPIHRFYGDGPNASRKRPPACTCIQRGQRGLEVRNSGNGATGPTRGGTGERAESSAETQGESYIAPTDRGQRGPAVRSLREDFRGDTLPGLSAGVAVGSARGPQQAEAHRAAIRSVYSAASSVEGRRKPIARTEVVAHHIHASSYAGLPHLCANELALETGLRLAGQIADNKRGFDPYLFGRRVQPGLFGPKTRLVWMAPLASTIIGLAFARPVQEALARNRPYIWGLRHHEEGAILAEFSGRYRYAYCLDWSQFDSSVPASLINDMFRVVRSMLDLTVEEDGLFHRYVNDFIHTRIVLPDGNVYQVHRGVPSGSAFTSLIDSMVNVYLVNYVWYRLTGHVLSHKQILVMGDDVVVGTSERLELAEIARVADELGFKLNTVKSVIVNTHEEGHGIHFIGHSWSRGRARRPQRELLQRASLPERHAEQSKSRSLTRLGGYALSSVDGLIILIELYPEESITGSVIRFLDDLRGHGGGSRLRAHDLPGDLRRRVMIEGAETPDVGVGSGPHGLLFGSLF
ncbi:hypothetical protein [Kummerowia striata partitivirus]|nr:hypothetical protein [Kummerowia striata partitivirus]